jgi:hypothetical protein
MDFLTDVTDVTDGYLVIVGCVRAKCFEYRLTIFSLTHPTNVTDGYLVIVGCVRAKCFEYKLTIFSLTHPTVS